MGKILSITIASLVLAGPIQAHAGLPPFEISPAEKLQKENEDDQNIIVLIEDQDGNLSVSWMTQAEWKELEKKSQKPPKLKKLKTSSKVQ